MVFDSFNAGISHINQTLIKITDERLIQQAGFHDPVFMLKYPASVLLS